MSKNFVWLGKIIPVLIRALPNLEHTGKQSVYWLLGEYACTNTTELHWAIDILRLATLDYAKQSILVKLQIMTLCIQLYASKIPEQEIIRVFLDHILSLAKFDKNIDVRDRSRFFRKFLDMEKIDLIQLLSMRTTLNNSKMMIEEKSYDFGTMSCFWDTQLKGYNRLPDFPKVSIQTFRGTGVIFID